MLRRDLNAYMSQIEDDLGCLLVFRCDGGKGHAVSAKPVSLLTRSNFLFLCLKTNKKQQFASLKHTQKTCKEDGVLTNTDPKTSLCVNQAKYTHTHTHSKHKVNAHIHTLLSTRHRTFSVFQTQLDELMGTCLLLSFDRLKTALQTGLSIYPSNTHAHPGFCRSGISRTDSIFPQTCYVCLAFQRDIFPNTLGS